MKGFGLLYLGSFSTSSSCLFQGLCCILLSHGLLTNSIFIMYLSAFFTRCPRHRNLTHFNSIDRVWLFVLLPKVDVIPTSPSVIFLNMSKNSPQKAVYFKCILRMFTYGSQLCCVILAVLNPQIVLLDIKSIHLFSFSGQHCELQADLCVALHPCHNGGECVGTPNSYKCRCPTGYGGTNCEMGKFS